MKSSYEREIFLSYKLVSQPTSLSHGGTIRATNKGALFALPTAKGIPQARFPDNNNALFIMDCGYLLCNIAEHLDVT